jgi:hypothetical protein
MSAKLMFGSAYISEREILMLLRDLDEMYYDAMKARPTRNLPSARGWATT